MLYFMYSTNVMVNKHVYVVCVDLLCRHDSFIVSDTTKNQVGRRLSTLGTSSGLFLVTVVGRRWGGVPRHSLKGNRL